MALGYDDAGKPDEAAKTMALANAHAAKVPSTMLKLELFATQVPLTQHDMRDSSGLS